MKKLSELVVKYNKIIIIAFVGLVIYSALCMRLVKVEYSITEYLPPSTDTKMALELMDDEFTTYGSASFIVRNVTFETASSLSEEIEQIEGVKSLPFENTSDYYASSTALFNITFEGDDEDETSVAAYDEIMTRLSPYDTLVASELVNSYADELQSDVNFILVLAVIIIVAVLTFTSNSFAEVPVFLLVFGVAALINMGTNFWFGTISFITNSVCIILQLALAIDYSIILSHRYAEERRTGADNKTAMAMALRKAIPEIFGSALTTVSGMLALACMSLRLGADLGFVLAKSIIVSMLTVFLLMPSLLLIFSKLITKTSHKSFVPTISFWGKAVLKCRHVIPVLFIAAFAVSAVLSMQLKYVYSENSISTDTPTESMVASEEINEIFGYKNQFVVLVPSGDYDIEKGVAERLEAESMVADVLCMSNVDMTLGNVTYHMTENLNYKQFADFIEMDRATAKRIYEAYAYFSCEESSDGLVEVAVFEANPDIYRASLLELADCALEQNDFIYAYLSDDADALDNYEDLKQTIDDAEAQLVGVHYTRIVANILGERESAETFDLIRRLLSSVKSYCPDAIFAGDSMSSYDLNESFLTDNLLITLLTIIFVYVVLMIVTKSWGIPILLVLTIQGAIFMNFAVFVLSGCNLFFFVYLIANALQMGATIDYAIVITNRYIELRLTHTKKQSAIQAVGQSFPTLLSSGSILTVASFLIYFLVGSPLISTLGLALGRGTLISLGCVMIVLPTLLYFFGDLVKKTRIPDFGAKLSELVRLRNEKKKGRK